MKLITKEIEKKIEKYPLYSQDGKGDNAVLHGLRKALFQIGLIVFLDRAHFGITDFHRRNGAGQAAPTLVQRVGVVG